MLIQRHHRGELHVKKEYRFGVLDVEEEHEGSGGASSLVEMIDSQNIGVKAVERVRL